MKAKYEILPIEKEWDVYFTLSEDAGSFVEPHWHEALEILYMIEGSMVVRYENQDVLIENGDFHIINANVIHSFLSKKNKTFVLQVPSRTMKRFVPDYDFLQFHLDKPNKENPSLTREKMEKQIYRMYQIYREKGRAYLLEFHSVLYELLYGLVKDYAYEMQKKEVLLHNRSLKKIEEIMDYIRENHANQISTQQIAEKFGYNPDYLNRFFKKYIGMTVMNYLYEIRINGICQDLTETDAFVYELFERHGCTNYKLAAKKFYERYGCSPAQKRKERKATGVKDEV